MIYFIDVVLPIPLEKHFTYLVTSNQAQILQTGMRVTVPFGKRKLYTAIVLKVHQNAPTVYEAKPIDTILDQYAIVNTWQLEHWQWMASYYLCTLGEVVRAALPKAFLLESETIIYANKEVQINEDTLTDNEFLIYEALENNASISIADVMAIVGKKTIMPLINSLLAKQVIVVKEKVYQIYRPKLVRYIKLPQIYEQEQPLEQLLGQLARAKKQRQLVMHLFQLQGWRQPVKASLLLKESQCSAATLKTLLDKGILEEIEIQEDRIANYKQPNKQVNINLSEPQQLALDKIKAHFKGQKPCLLHGVTASGKTEVYLKLMETYVAKNQQVLYLLPEIALTTQLIVRLQRFFDNKVAVYHSKYSVNERVEVWQNVLLQKPKAQIVIGARSALFLPYSNLGLVVIDEEHEATFKQFDPAPRYHARDAALVLAKMHGAHCILGSATPSIESYKNALDNKYGLATLTQRFNNVLLPDIKLVDLKEARRKKRMKGHFAETLFLQIEETLKEKQQIILFQNRRGYAPIVACSTCGHTEHCPNCDVGLTFHQYKNQLRCHYCGYFESLQPSCKACGNASLDTQGIGTEQIQEQVEKLFAQAKVARMDLDTTRGKYAYQKIITAFENQEIDILVGTQMVTKGLDFRNVGLVGILNADTLLNFPDYRAHERSFQLLTQVAGRAGRTNIRGKVLIQTYNPYHKILQQVTTNSYSEMFTEQLFERRQFKYPPIIKIIKLTLKAKDYNKLNDGALWLVKALTNTFQDKVLGPEAPLVGRIKREYLKNILIKVPTGQSLSKTKNSIKRIQQSFDAIGRFKGIRVIYNVDHL